MANNLFQGAYYSNEIEHASYPIGVASKGYDASGKPLASKTSFLSDKPVAVMKTPEPVKRSKYINPATGGYFTPDEYANYVASKIPKGDIPKTATDAMTNPNQTTTQLEGTARNLNNARNDLAVGETSIFPGSDTTPSGEQIIYSPAEKEAIRKASAGIYDPALNDVFARLKTKQDEEDAKARREEQIFATNESIRQWKATTGSKTSPSGSDLFTQTQLNTGARNAGMTIDGFSQLDEDLQNFFVSPPTGKDEITGETKKISQFFEEDIAAVKAGEKKVKDVAADIENSTLPDSVKHYYIDQLPLTDVEKTGFWSKIWGLINSPVEKK